MKRSISLTIVFLILFAAAAFGQDTRLQIRQSGVIQGSTRILDCIGVTCTVELGVGKISGAGSGSAAGGTVNAIGTDLLVNSTTETDIYSMVLDGGTLGDRYCARQKISGIYTSDGVATLTLKAKYGTDNHSITVTPDALTNAPFEIGVKLCGRNATNAQEIIFDAKIGTTATDPFLGSKALAIDSTVNQTLAFSVQWSSVGAGQTLTRRHADTSVSGTVVAATQLVANGANCSAGNFPLGVDALGAVEGCTDAATQAELNTHTGSSTAHSAANLTFSPTGSIAATNIQAAIAEVAGEAQPLDAELTALAGKQIQGTGVDLRMSTGAFIPGNCVETDASGNFIDAGDPCGTGAGGGGEGDITRVWSTLSGAVSALSAGAGDSFDATSADASKPCKAGTTVPATCAPNSCFRDTDDASGTGLYLCTATDTWIEVASNDDLSAHTGLVASAHGGSTSATPNSHAVRDGSANITASNFIGNLTGTATTATGVSANAVSNTGLADMPTATIKGRVTAGTGDPQDLTAAQATSILDTFTTSLKGLAPASGGGTVNYLRADGTWAAPPGTTGGVTSFNTRTGAVTSATNDYTGTQVSNTPAGAISATNIQAALNELDSEKCAVSGCIMTGSLTTTSLTTTGTAEGEVLFNEASANGTEYVGFIGNASRTGNIKYRMPATDPLANQVLSAAVPSGGISQLSWADASAGTGDITDVFGCTTGNCNALTAAAGDSLNMASGDSSIPGTLSTSLPGTCTEGQVHQDTDSGGTETHVCTATNTWTKLIAAADNVATATALAANPTDCSANQFANAIAASGNLTCAGLGDADIPDTITASNYLLLTGGTLTGQLITDNLGVEFDESDTNPTCAAGNYNIFADLSENKLKKCTNGTVSDLDTAGAGGGDYTGPASSTDNAIHRFDGITGKLGQNSTVTLGDGGEMQWTDTTLVRDFANILTLRNGTTAQEFGVANTWTSTSVYEWVSLSWLSNVATIRTEHVGGSARNLAINYGNSASTAITVPTSAATPIDIANASPSTSNATSGQVRVSNGAAHQATSGTTIALNVAPTFSSTSTATTAGIGLRIGPTVNYSNATPGAGGYEAIKVAVTETALQTGLNYLIRASAGAAGTTDRFFVENSGRVTQAGHHIFTGSAPSVSSCGTTPSIVGNDTAGKVTIGTGTVTSCTVTFVTTFANAPICTVTNNTTIQAHTASTSTTALTIAAATNMASDVISYTCVGRN